MLLALPLHLDILKSKNGEPGVGSPSYPQLSARESFDSTIWYVSSSTL